MGIALMPTCIDCRHVVKPDTLSTLPPSQRSGYCPELMLALTFEIGCGTYCLGGTVSFVEVPLDFGCNRWEAKGEG